MSVHVFVERDQPATAYRDPHGPSPRRVFRCSPRHPIVCWTCGRTRWAKNMVVKVYYDCNQYFCREGHDSRGRTKDA